MTHKPILIKDISLSFPHKTCFLNFSSQIDYGSYICIIGRNGSGKSGLLNILFDQINQNLNVLYIPQIRDDLCSSSGGEYFIEKFILGIRTNPDIIILDEPTNHLDLTNRRTLIKMLDRYKGTVIIASHDPEILDRYALILWHIDNENMNISKSGYRNYMIQRQAKLDSTLTEISKLDQEKKSMHELLMREQKRASKSNIRGKKSIRENKWPTIVSDEKARRAVETGGKKKKALFTRKDYLIEKLNDLRLPEIIIHKFSLDSDMLQNQNLVSINSGSIFYDTKLVLQNINLSVNSNEKLAITGDNGSGKTSLIKAIIGDSIISKEGDWHVLHSKDIGYLDQHYDNICSNQTVFESIKSLVPDWCDLDIRKHLNDFLFRKNEEVNTEIKYLSGGERARIALAQIAVKPLKLLILDEITNNLDIETREHVIQILKNYPGAMIIISHDLNFLDAINVTNFYYT